MRKKIIIDAPHWVELTTRLIMITLVVLTLVLSFVPWQQTSSGEGEILALDPTKRIQNISTFVKGRVVKWYVRDGDSVKKGDKIAEIGDIDPNYMMRVQLERDAAKQKYDAAEQAAITAKSNLERQTKLFKEGLSSELSKEKALISYKKQLGEEAGAAASLAKAEVQLSRQFGQVITAPSNGTILQTIDGADNSLLKQGQMIAVFVPDTDDLAAEIFIDGNDLPLVTAGRKVRLQFEGWPAVQFSGWPSLAVGTFGGVVQSVDPSSSRKGKFRVVIIPDHEEKIKWPDRRYLRQGTRVYGWVLLNEVSIGYELWRQFNGFPLSFQDDPEKKKKK